MGINCNGNSRNVVEWMSADVHSSPWIVACSRRHFTMYISCAYSFLWHKKCYATHGIFEMYIGKQKGYLSLHPHNHPHPTPTHISVVTNGVQILHFIQNIYIYIYIYISNALRGCLLCYFKTDAKWCPLTLKALSGQLLYPQGQIWQLTTVVPFTKGYYHPLACELVWYVMSS